MLVRALLQTSLVLWLVQNTIQGGVRPQAGALGRLASRGPGIGAKTGVAGILGARGYGAGRPGKTGAYRPTAIRGGLKQGYGTLGYGGAANLGTGFGTGLGAGLGAAGLGLGTGYGLGNGLGAALGYPAGKLGGRGYTSNGYGAQLGYGAGGYPGAGRGAGPTGGQLVSQGERANGYGHGGVPNGQRTITNGFPSRPGVTNGPRARIKGYGPAVDMSNGQGVINNGAVLPSRQGTKPSNKGYGLGAAGYLGAGFSDGYGAAGLGVGGYPQGVRAGKQIGYGNGYGSDVYGTADGYGGGPVYPSVLADNIGLNGAAGFGAGGLGGPGMIVNPGLGTDAKSRKYGAGGVLGAAGSLPYGGQPVVSAGLGPQGKTGGYGGTTYGGIPTLEPDTGLGGTGGAMEPLAGGAVGQNPYSAPVIAAGIDVDTGYPFGAEQLSLGADVTKTAAKYGTGYAAALSTGGQGSYGGQKDGSKLSGMYGNGYKG
ncbi:glycine-rich cell wall structural protein 1 isoform X3 [Pimephales promelas]|uniref:glycine-rich cell wall structural protein 1 isoform X3 n=1 Tax=Pimephales promelas TaxID=90988 RepID=UPI001955C9D3|nr:glycine-rich cell wall structural protein 1 isoform X3 [Pimephales promelas]